MRANIYLYRYFTMQDKYFSQICFRKPYQPENIKLTILLTYDSLTFLQCLWNYISIHRGLHVKKRNLVCNISGEKVTLAQLENALMQAHLLDEEKKFKHKFTSNPFEWVFEAYFIDDLEQILETQKSYVNLVWTKLWI